MEGIGVNSDRAETPLKEKHQRKKSLRSKHSVTSLWGEIRLIKRTQPQ